MVIQFPPVDAADKSGLLAVGGDVKVPTLKRAYKSGIFPWPHEGYPLFWFAPPKRAILNFKDFKIPKRLQRDLKKCSFNFTVNRDFEGVIRACAASKTRKGEGGTWITDEIIQGYIRFHQAGFAISFETRNEKGKLVGGLYGVKIGKMFAGESMFFKVTNASKFALIQTVYYLKDQGLKWMDVQVLNPFLESFGVKEIRRTDFMKKLKKALD